MFCSSEVDYLKGSESEPKELGGDRDEDKEDVIAALTVQRIDVSRNIPDNMLRALEASSQNQANDMQVLTKLLSAANDNIAQQSSQSVWANNMLACLAEDFHKQQEQLRVQAACIQSLQQAMESIARQQRFQGPIPGYSGQSNHFGISAVPGPGWLPPSGRNSGTSSPTPKQNQSKSVKGSTSIAIRLLHPGSDIQDLPSTTAPPSIQHHPSELELLLKNQPKDTRPSETHPPEPAVGQSTGTKRLRGPLRDDWFIWTRDHNSTKSIYEEFRRYESELKAKLEPTDGNSKRRARLPQRQADNTERHVSNIRRIANEVDLIQKRLMQDDTLSRDEALLAAFEEIDDLVQRRSRDGNYSCNQATELCTEQMIARGELKTRK
ncbi:hypothetical protein EC957_007873 [Mortierella hygrophila]|uniref:Uncharacterized protein n=1 Tax=Mortierella hygrophila TaxID=979708 RepID=A0A9P6K5V2_9FUNG|nr:hypothetical protein EC957_007873 [Mortierella hygrophila]